MLGLLRARLGGLCPAGGIGRGFYPRWPKRCPPLFPLPLSPGRFSGPGRREGKGRKSPPRRDPRPKRPGLDPCGAKARERA